MAMRLQEVHPALVHFPIVLLPVSIGADLLGRASGNESLMELGRRTMPFAVASGLLAGVAGLMAQSEVDGDDSAMDVLKTHRTLNLGLVAASAGMAAVRARNEKPGLGYLLGGLAAVAVLGYSAYLGGKMVYTDGLGVEAADGVRKRPRVPELTRRGARRAARTAMKDLEKGIQTTVEETAKGELVPEIVSRFRPREESSRRG